MHMNLPTCCQDIELEPIQLIFPERQDEDWQEFVEIHGIDFATFGELRKGALDMGNGKVRIFHRCQHLQDDGRCGIQVGRGYEAKPKICRDFDCSRRSDCPCKGSGKPWQPITLEAP